MDHHVRAYADFLESKTDLRMPLKVVCDFSNGPTSIVARELARRLSSSLHMVPMNDSVHPDFPAHGPDPSVPAAATEIGKKVVETRADLGVIFDGDGDRAVFVDERGVPVPPVAVALFLMKNIPGPHVLDALLYEAATHLDPSLIGSIFASKVGRFFISRTMREKGASIGAEFSGHFFFRDFFGLDSALLTMISVLNLISRTEARASSSFSRYGGHSVVAAKACLSRPFSSVAEDIKLSVSSQGPRISELDGLTVDFGDRWVNLRPSNTEPVIRITAGAPDPIVAEALGEEFRKAVA